MAILCIITLAILFASTTPSRCVDPKTFSTLLPNHEVNFHKLTTPDDYNLILFHVKSNNPPESSTPPKGIFESPLTKVILIMHGVFDSSDNFAAMDNSIVEQLSDRGYDIWLGNNRGNKYSCSHNKYTPAMKQFWDFSFQEMAEFDLPVFIQFVKDETGQDQITLMGHSQGGTQIVAALSESSEMQDSLSMPLVE